MPADQGKRCHNLAMLNTEGRAGSVKRPILASSERFRRGRVNHFPNSKESAEMSENYVSDRTIEPQERYAHWLLRIALASVFLYMGIDKFMGGGIEEFSQLMGLPMVIGGMVPVIEIIAGILILLGAWAGDFVTRLGALAMLPVLLGAIFMQHWGQWHFMATPSHPLGGMMFQVTLLLLALYMMARGNHA